MARLTLQQIAGQTYFIPAPANIGLYVKDSHAILIDSGNDKDAGRQILNILQDCGWTLDLIINTHSNADHIGGNAFLQQKTGCRIAATRLETAFIQDPVLEPAFLYGGFPLKAMRNKFLMAPPSQVTDILTAPSPILGTGLEAIPLPGHYIDMIGIKTPDDVAFIADTLFPEKILNKYHILFLYDIRAHLDTLEMLKDLEAEHFIPGHGDPTTDLASLIAVNGKQVEEIINVIHTICRGPIGIEELLAQVCRKFQIELDVNQYVLVGSTLRSFLAYLSEQGQMRIEFTEGKMVCQSTREDHLL